MFYCKANQESKIRDLLFCFFAFLLFCFMALWLYGFMALWLYGSYSKY